MVLICDENDPWELWRTNEMPLPGRSSRAQILQRVNAASNSCQEARCPNPHRRNLAIAGGRTAAARPGPTNVGTSTAPSTTAKRRRPSLGGGWMIYNSLWISCEALMQVAKWGNSLAVRLPSAVVQALDLKEGDQIEIRIAGDASSR